MARLPDVLDDHSSLNGPRIDVRRRVGWLLRTSRVHGASHGLTGGRFAESVGVTAGSVTKWEKGTEEPDAAVVEGYERHAGLPPGTLRAVIEQLRRSFRMRSRTAADDSRGLDLDALSRRVQPAMTGRPLGIDWLRLAEALDSSAMRLPDFTARPVVSRLVSETARAVGPGFLVRFAALARLRTSAYHQVVQDSVLTFALDPQAQVVGEVMATLAERPTVDLIDRMVDLLDHPSLPVVRGAARTIVTAEAVRGELVPEDLQRVASQMLAAYSAGAGDPDRHAVLSEMLRNLPRGFHRLVEDRGLPPMAAAPMVEHATRAHPAYRAAETVAAEVMRELGAREEPLLARTVFEALFDVRLVKARAATFVLAALPYRDLVADALLTLAEEHPDEQVRAAATILPAQFSSAGRATAERWTHDPDRARQIAGLMWMGHHAEVLDEDWLDVLVHDHGSEVARRALYAAGMGGQSSLLDKWVGDDRVRADLRLGAQWWAEQGGRVTDLDR